VTPVLEGDKPNNESLLTGGSNKARHPFRQKRRKGITRM
jgi:hypothetical protein